MQVSVVVITYEPSIDKLLATLSSIIRQNSILFELIISDDGSKSVNVDDLEKKVSEIVPERIPLRFIKNRKNSGTVHNICNACRVAAGEYIKILSPGDMLYDDDVLYDLYTSAIKTPQKAFFFGRAAYYSNDGTLKLYETSTPSYPGIFDSNDQNVHDLAMMFGQGPVGASYFYKTESFNKYLGLIVGHVKFTEDYTTSILYLLDGEKLSFIDRKVVWYEYGLGISTSNAQRWKEIYENDCRELYEVAKKLHPDNKFLEFRFGDRRKRFFHPVLILYVIRIRWISKSKAEMVSNTRDQIAFLESCLKTRVEEES